LIVTKEDMDKLVEMTDSFDHTFKSRIKVTQHPHPVIVFFLPDFGSLNPILLSEATGLVSRKRITTSDEVGVQDEGRDAGSGLYYKEAFPISISPKKKTVWPTFHPVFKTERIDFNIVTIT
jgi:hypothetical protein